MSSAPACGSSLSQVIVLAALAVVTPADVTKACGDEPGKLCETVLDATGSEFWARAADWLIAKPLQIAIIFLVAWVANRVARVVVKRVMARVLNPPAERARRAIRRATPNMLLHTSEVNMRAEARVRTLTTVFRSLASVLIWFTALLWILEAVFHFNPATLLASAGLLGVALGFGAQNVVRDFLAGTFLVVEDQFGVGDIVDLGEAKGTVERITLRATRVRDVQGTVWHVPNGQILRVANKSQEWARAVLDIEVDTETDYNEAAALIQQVADQMVAEPDWRVDVLDHPEVWGIEAFTTDGYTIRFVVKTRPGTQFGIMREMRIRLSAAFAEHNILLPGEKPEMWLYSGDPKIEKRPRHAEERISGSQPVVPATATDPGVVPGPPPEYTTASADPDGASADDEVHPVHPVGSVRPKRGDPSEAG